MDALIKGNDLNKLKERVMLNKLNEGEWVKQTKGKGDVLNKLWGMPKKKPQGKGGALNNVKDGGYSNQTERKKVS